MRKSLLHSTLIISFFTFLSRILGLLRDIVFANLFGATAMMDAFNVAFRIPNLFRRFFGEGALNQAFVPVFNEYHQQRSHHELKQFFAQISGTLACILLSLTILGVIFAPQLVMLFAAGFSADPAKFALTSTLVQIMFPYVFFICMAALTAGVLNSLNQFTVPACTMMILNICMICAALTSQSFDQPMIAIAYSIIVAGCLQFSIPYWFIYKQNLLTMPTVAFHSSSVRRVITLMIPALIGSSSAQINLLINTQLASRLPTGSITWLYYSDRLTEFVLGTIAVAIGTVLLPKLSKLHASTNHTAFVNTLHWGMRLAFIVGIPSTLGLILLAKPILAVLFMRGQFSLFDVEMSAQSLVAFSSSITAYFIIRVLAPAYYARQNTKTPVKFGLIAIASNIALQFILVQYLAHAGLALSSAIAAWINAILLIIGLWHLGIYKITGILNRQFLALIPANLILLSILWYAASWENFWITGTFLLRFTALFSTIIISITAYFASLHFCGFSLKQLKQLDI